MSPSAHDSKNATQSQEADSAHMSPSFHRSKKITQSQEEDSAQVKNVIKEILCADMSMIVLLKNKILELNNESLQKFMRDGLIKAIKEHNSISGDNTNDHVNLIKLETDDNTDIIEFHPPPTP